MSTHTLPTPSTPFTPSPLAQRTAVWRRGCPLSHEHTTRSDVPETENITYMPNFTSLSPLSKHTPTATLSSHTPHLTGLGKDSGSTLTNQRRASGHQVDQLPSNRLLLEHSTGGSTPRLVECPQCADTGADNGIVTMTDTWAGQRVKSESKGVFFFVPKYRYSHPKTQQLEIDTGKCLYHLDQVLLTLGWPCFEHIGSSIKELCQDYRWSQASFHFICYEASWTIKHGDETVLNRYIFHSEHMFNNWIDSAGFLCEFVHETMLVPLYL